MMGSINPWDAEYDYEFGPDAVGRAFVAGRTVYLRPDQVSGSISALLTGPPEILPFTTDLSVLDGADVLIGSGVLFTRGRVVYLRSDMEPIKMQLLSLLSWGPTGPMDNDPFTFDATRWLATVAGDVIVSGGVTVTNQDTTPQSSVTVSAFTLQSPLATAWLTGGQPGVTYLVTLHMITQAGRMDAKSALLSVVASRS